MIALMLALAPLVPVQDTEQMRVRPTTEAEAVAEFEATCVAGLFDTETLKRAAAASSRGYTLSDGGDASWRNWTSPYGSIHYLRGVEATSSLTPKCNLVSFTRDTVNRGTLDAALRAMAKRQAGRGYRQLSDNNGLYWSFYDRAGHPMTVQVALDRRTPHQLVLTLKPYVTT